jgi:hypothetical protein
MKTHANPPTRQSVRLLPALALALLFSGVDGRAQTAAVVTDHANYLPNEPIIASFVNGPGNPLDWVGIYPDGVEPGSVGSTLWLYVGGTQTGSAGLKEGSVTFPTGLALAGDYAAFLLLNDGYTKLAETKFKVIDPSQPHVRLDKRLYQVSETITVGFTNGPGNAKDWIGIYPEDRLPGNGNSLIWAYVDGTQNGNSGLRDGVVTLSGGLPTAGAYVAYLLENDGYTVLASESFSIPAPAASTPRLLSITPTDSATNVHPFVQFKAVITNGVSRLVASTAVLKLDNAAVIPGVQEQDGLVTITYSTPTALPAGSAHEYVLTYSDNASPANNFTNRGAFTISPFINLSLPAPVFFENFDSTDEGKLPAGWAVTNYSDIPDENVDPQDLNSKFYANWAVVDVSRFNNELLSYDGHTPTTDYQRVLTPNPEILVDGKPAGVLASGRMIFATSGYRSGGNQYLLLFTRDFDLRGRANVHLSYHSLYEQNQDSMGSVEYSIDQGKSWLPVVYMLDAADIAKDPEGKVDAVATFTADQGDTAFYIDPATGEQKGGNYGAFIGAGITAGLAPYISARFNDNTVESKRIELFHLPQADNQPNVRFRFAYAGTDSWYFGVDNFGLYEISGTPAPAPTLSARRSINGVVVSWPAEVTGYTLEAADSLVSPAWAAVPGVANNSVELPATGVAKYLRLRK